LSSKVPKVLAIELLTRNEMLYTASSPRHAKKTQQSGSEFDFPALPILGMQNGRSAVPGTAKGKVCFYLNWIIDLL
jgi:hypothetical protein